MRILGRLVDERFLEHRRRSTSVAGMVAAALSLLLFEFHLLVHHQYRWELFAVGVTFVAVKLAILLFYRLTD